ncbi:MAG: hypothetical protein ABI864_03850 [Chloroflexota bacterium]
MRPLRSYLALLTIVAITVACSPGSSSGGESRGAEPSTGSQPSRAAASSGGGGGGSGGIGKTLADGQWTSGTAHLDYSGDKSGSFDAPLFAITSLTTGGTSVLTFIDTEKGLSATVAIYPDSFAVSVTTAAFTGGAGTTTNCTVTYQAGDEHNIEASFNCQNAPVIFTTGGNGTVNLEGTLSASR